jgi:ankyrin repeat and BTB/POZ domain-containing protein 1
VVQLLLEAGALCERDTFQGERCVKKASRKETPLTTAFARCLYNALNDRIRNLLLSYDYSRSTNPLQPLAFHISSLLVRDHPKTADITVSATDEYFHLHKFILSARSPYFKQKLSATPETTTWKLPSSIPPQSFSFVIRYLYMGELPRDLGGGPGTGYTDSEVLAGTDKICKHLEIQSLLPLILDSTDRRIARQRKADELERGRDQLDEWFRDNVLKHKIVTDTSRADDVKWDSDNGIFADVLIRADEDGQGEEDAPLPNGDTHHTKSALGIPIGPPSTTPSRSHSLTRRPRTSVLFPTHRAMLIRSEFFLAMFSSPFREALPSPHLQIIPIACSPAVLEIILTFLYTERADFGLDLAVDVLFAADLLFLEKLKAKAGVVISTLGNGTATAIPTDTDDEPLDIYEIIRAAWLTRVQRLEEFAARYIAYRLEQYIDEDEFAELVMESAGRISRREETDSIELLDDIRYYLSERFRLRFEDSGLEDVMDEEMAVVEAERERPASVAAARAEEKGLPNWGAKQDHQSEDEGIDVSAASVPTVQDAEALLQAGVVRTLDGEIAGDEFAADAVNYQILLGKIDELLKRLKLDA